MTTVRIAHVEPRPGRQPDGGFRIHSFLVVLADDPGGRALPIWLAGPRGHGLWQIVAPGAGPPIHEAEAQTARLLRAAGVAVTGADVDELDADPVDPAFHVLSTGAPGPNRPARPPKRQNRVAMSQQAVGRP